MGTAPPMTHQQPDAVDVEPQNPEPEYTAGLEQGGGVAPGDTPPGESAVGGPTHEPPRRGRTGPITALCMAALLIVIIAGGLVARAVGLF